MRLNSAQIITLNDYPLYSASALKEYLSNCKSGQKVPFVPVIRIEVVRKHFGEELLKILKKFEKGHPKARYFLLDGSHRTTALTLAGRKIPIIIYEKSQDITAARKLVATGQILENDTLNHTLEENCEILNRHFKEKPYFRTVEEKTRRMVREKVILRPAIPPQPIDKKSCFIIIRGPLGVGKSAVAKKLSKILRAEYISIDSILEELGLDKVPATAECIPAKNFIKADKYLLPKVRKKLKEGKIIVLDGNFYHKGQIKHLIKHLSDYESYVFTLKAPLGVCIERDKHRAKPYGKWAAKAVYNLVSRFDYGTIINTENKTLISVVKAILSNFPASFIVSTKHT